MHVAEIILYRVIYKRKKLWFWEIFIKAVILYTKFRLLVYAIICCTRIFCAPHLDDSRKFFSLQSLFLHYITYISYMIMHYVSTGLGNYAKKMRFYSRTVFDVCTHQQHSFIWVKVVKLNIKRLVSLVDAMMIIFILYILLNFLLLVPTAKNFNESLTP